MSPRLTAWAARCLHGPAMILALTITGCDAGRGEISGTVRYGGKVVSSGQVTVVSASDASIVARSLILNDGSYKVADCPLGQVKIAVQTAIPRSGTGRAGKQLGANADSSRVKLPVRYADPTSSGLETTVNRGQHRFDIDLKP